MKTYKINYQIIQDIPKGSVEIDAETEKQAREIFNERADDDPVQLLLDAKVADPNQLKVKIDEVKESK